MKRAVYILFLILSFSWVQLSAQSSSLTDSNGNMEWQYHRSAFKDPANPNRVIVIFVFVNGNHHSAISYRQEMKPGEAQWIELDGGVVTEKKNYTAITYRLIPNQAILLKYSIQLNRKNRNNQECIGKSALFVLDPDYNVWKEKFNDCEFLK